MLLEMKDVVKQFGGLTAVSNMSFHVDEGEIYGVIGPNGAGKTTIFNLITGVYQVTEGDVIFNGQSIEGKKPYQIINLGIARTFQNIRLFTGMTVLENILVGVHDRMKSGLLASIIHTASQQKEEKEACEEAMKLLAFVGLDKDGYQAIVKSVRACEAKHGYNKCSYSDIKTKTGEALCTGYDYSIYGQK